MGILNVTPDSFSDGGKYASPEAAVDRAVEMVAQGADLIDIGGESTRPGSLPVPEEEQLRRVIPVIRRIRALSDVPISIDTTRAAVAEASLDAGADLVNDISAGLDDERMLPLVARRQVPVVLMHMQGKPLTMQVNPVYGDVVGEVKHFLSERLTFARTIGIDPADVVLDPGFGFGKTVAHNLELLRGLAELKSLGCPLLVGVSRKKFIGVVTGETGDRPIGTAAVIAWCAANGAGIVRVHDVAAAVMVTRMIRAVQNARVEERGSRVEDRG
jgi:dihydropteroate synthase